MRLAETDLRRVFQASLWLKGLHSLTEVVGGLALAFLSHDVIVRIASAMTRAELMEDPRDIVANAPHHATEGFTTDAQSFAAWYLFSHGLIKLVLVMAVLTNRIWAYASRCVSPRPNVHAGRSISCGEASGIRTYPTSNDTNGNIAVAEVGGLGNGREPASGRILDPTGSLEVDRARECARYSHGGVAGRHAPTT